MSTDRPRLAASEGKRMDVQMLVEHYLRSGRIANKSTETLNWYERRLRQFVDFLKRQRHSMRISDLTRADGEAYIDHLMSRDVRWANHPYHKPHQGEKLSINTVHGHVRAIRALTHWASEERYLPADPFKRLPLPKLPKRLYEILSEKEIDRILTHVSADNPRGMRLRTIFLILLDSGIRATELAKLKMTDVDLNNGTIKVMGKGNKERYVPIGQATQKEIDTYVHFYRPKPAVPDIEELLLTEDGVPFTYSALATTMRRIRKAIGLKRLHMPKVRHTALTKMIENGVPAFAVQQFAGHSSIATTEGYVHLAQQRTANRFNSGSVVDKLPTIQELNRRGRQRR